MRRCARRLAMTLGMSLGLVSPALASDLGMSVPPEGPVFAQYQTVPDEELAKMRGGFVLPSGLLNFAIDLAAQINGQPIYKGSLTFSPANGFQNSIQHFDTSGLGLPVRGNVSIGDAVKQVVASVQAGDGNIMPAHFDTTSGLVMTVQNTLSNVVIQQQLQMQLDFAAAELLRAQGNASLRQRLQQVRTLGVGQ